MSGQGLTFLEHEYARALRRVQKIREHPDPLKAKSNALFYELEADLRAEQIEAAKGGKCFAAIWPNVLIRALGMVPWDAIRTADRTSGAPAKKYFDIIRAEGMAEHTCDRTIVLVPMVLGGDYPRPDLIVAGLTTCVPINCTYRLISHVLDVPMFVIDRPTTSWTRLEGEKEIRYLADQYGEMIEWVEAKLPDCRYDEDRLIEYLHYEKEYYKYEEQIWKLRAHVPCPIAGRDAFREMRRPSFYRNPKDCVEYMRVFVDEMNEKVARNALSVEGEEKLRLIWSNTGPFFADPFGWLSKRGVAVPAVEMGPMNPERAHRHPLFFEPWQGRKLNPLEEAIRLCGNSAWGGMGQDTVQSHLDTARELKIDGIVYYLQWGCEVTMSYGSIVAELAERELGIPTLLLEGRQLDESSFNATDFYQRLEEFLEICTEAKKKRTLRRQEIGK